MFRRTLLTAVLSLTVSYTAHAQSYTDKAAHTSGFVSANGVRLHYLDFGGQGDALVFLAGFGNSAHIFDDIAPAFTDKHRVVALTRRGHGESEAPAGGYDLPTLVEDIRVLLDSLHIEKATLVGHSFAGDEITMFAAKYPKRVDKLVYLEAAYDRSMKVPPNPNPTPRATKDDVASFEAYKAYWRRARGFWSDAVEADLRATSFTPAGTMKSTISRETATGIMKNAQDYPMTYSHVKAPVLAFYNQPADSARLEYEQQNIMKLKAEHPHNVTIVEFDHSNHYVFITQKNEVIRELKEFLK